MWCTGSSLMTSLLLQATEGVCPVCSKAFDADAKVPINGTPEQVTR